MRKKSLFVLALLICGSTQAQEIQRTATPTKYTYLQAQGGINFSKYYGNLGLSFQSGTHTGITVGHKLNRLFFVEYGVSYLEKGYAVSPLPFTTVQGAETFRYSETTNYLSVPLSAGIEIGDRVKFKFRQGVGLDFLVGAHSEFVEGDNDPVKVTTYMPVDANGNTQILPYAEAFKRFDISLISSAGIKIPFGKFYAGSDIQFMLGTINPRKNAVADQPPKYLNLSGTVNIGMRL